ncbi:MAG: hypothetical protein ND807_17305 [Vicinamibacterales bacterium]|nr:hypothetical protein [Vicinamibacterales bacterium]
MTQRSPTYSEPTVMWRLRHIDGRTAHALILPSRAKASAVWFISGVPVKARDFKNWRTALEWLDDERVTLETSGWSWWERPKPMLHF